MLLSRQTYGISIRISLSAILGLLAVASLAQAGVTLKEETIGGKKAYRLENYRLSLVINPGQGGAVTSYVDKLGGNVELIQQEARRGLCMDHFQAQNWPGEMLDAAYDAEVVRDSEEESIVRLRCRVKGLWQGANFPKLKDILLEKSYALRSGRPALKCTVKITAPDKESTLFAYWLQNIFFAGGTYDIETDVTFRPSARGVRRKAGKDFGITGNEDWLKDFSDGWMALLDTKMKTGLVILSDYHTLNILYTNVGNRTLEPMYRLTFLPAGASVEYTTYVVPVAGLDNVVAATGEFIAGYSMKSDGAGNGDVSLYVVRSVKDAGPLSMDVEVTGVEDPKSVVKAGAVRFDALNDKARTGSVSFEKAGPDPLVLKVQAGVEADGPKIVRYFEVYYNGSYKWGENIQTDMATPVYVAERPLQKIDLQKPENLKLDNVWSAQVWYAEGLLDNAYDVTAAVRLTGMYHPGQTRRDRSFVIRGGGGFGTKLSSFPYDYEELLKYDFIILGGVKGDALGQVGDEMLADFLGAGGGMVVLGGPRAYGMSGLKGSRLEELWPVTMQDRRSDLVALESASIEVAENRPFLEDLDWSVKPGVKFIHEVKVKPWGRVILTAGDRPFLVIGESGESKARVACILAPPMGTLGEGETPFWKWADWPYLLRQVFWWVQKEDHRFAMP